MAHRKEVAGKWRKRFLSAMARTANAKLSARMAGVDHSTAYLLRGRDPGFAAAWLRARDWGRARVKAEGRPVFAGGRPRPARPGEAIDPRSLIIRTSKNAGAQIVEAGEGRWNAEAEEIFFAHLAAGWGVRRSAEAAGFSAQAVHKRRGRDPAFAARWDEAREHGLERNDMLLIDSVQWTLDPAAVEAAEDLPRPTIDEALRIQRFYRRVEGRGGRSGRARFRREPSIEQVRDEIIGRIRAIRRHREGGKRG
jgi:hypothetical protein